MKDWSYPKLRKGFGNSSVFLFRGNTRTQGHEKQAFAVLAKVTDLFHQVHETVCINRANCCISTFLNYSVFTTVRLQIGVCIQVSLALCVKVWYPATSERWVVVSIRIFSDDANFSILQEFSSNLGKWSDCGIFPYPGKKIPFAPPVAAINCCICFKENEY